MCHLFYIAADHPLHMIKGDWRYPGLTVSEVDEIANQVIRRLLTAEHLYYVGSWQGCGCGFYYENQEQLEATLADIPDTDICENSRAAWQSSYDSIASLRRYLADAAASGPVQLYMTWDGDQGNPIQSRATVTPTWFGEQLFDTLKDDSLLTVVPA